MQCHAKLTFCMNVLSQEFIGELNEPAPPSGFHRSLAICDMTNDLGNSLGCASLFKSGNRVKQTSTT